MLWAKQTAGEKSAPLNLNTLQSKQHQASRGASLRQLYYKELLGHSDWEEAVEMPYVESLPASTRGQTHAELVFTFHTLWILVLSVRQPLPALQ